MGIAIGLCHSFGIHQDMPCISTQGPTEQQRAKLHRRMWWTCFARDRWLSLAIGTPLRIDLDDATTSKTTTEDVMDELDDLSTQLRDRYLPQSASSLVQCWLNFVELSEVLGSIIQAFFRRKRAEPTILEIQTYEHQLARIKPNGGGDKVADPLPF